jgi:hypothetical protein
MILLSELSRRRIRSVQKLIRVGRNEVVVVMRVDPDKGEPYFAQTFIPRCKGIDLVLRSSRQVTSTCQSDESLRKRSSSARSSTKRERRSTRSSSRSPRSAMSMPSDCTRASSGPWERSMDTPTMLSSSPLREFASGPPTLLHSLAESC